jgi:hypothetical protein
MNAKHTTGSPGLSTRKPGTNPVGQASCYRRGMPRGPKTSLRRIGARPNGIWYAVVSVLVQMEQLPISQSCTVCGGPNFEGCSVCRACEEAFSSAGANPDNSKGIDLNRYIAKMFPWEPSGLTPRLLSGRWLWSMLCFGLIFVVVLLSLLRTPLPTCWETSL